MQHGMPGIASTSQEVSRVRCDKQQHSSRAQDSLHSICNSAAGGSQLGIAHRGCPPQSSPPQSSAVAINSKFLETQKLVMQHHAHTRP